MTKKQARRLEVFLPRGIPSKVRIYDNGGETCDNYTVVFTGNYRKQTGGVFVYIGMSGAPYHPQGICQHGSHHTQIDAPKGWPPAVGRSCHLGKRITFQDLPEVCQHVILEDYALLWDLPNDR